MVQVKDDWHGGIPSPPIWPQHQLGGIIKRNLGSLGVSQEQESSHHGDFELVLGDPENVRVSFFWVESYLISFKCRSYNERNGIYHPRREFWSRDCHLRSPSIRIQCLRCSWNHLSVLGHGNHRLQSGGPLDRVSENLPSIILETTHGTSHIYIYSSPAEFAYCVHWGFEAIPPLSTQRHLAGRPSLCRALPNVVRNAIPSVIFEGAESVNKSPTRIQLKNVDKIAHDLYSCGGGQGIVEERHHRSFRRFDKGKVSEHKAKSIGEETTERCELGFHILHVHGTTSLSTSDTFMWQLLGNTSISDSHSIGQIIHNRLPCLSSRSQRNEEFFTSVRLVFELRQTSSPNERKSDVHRTDSKGGSELSGPGTMPSGGISRAEGQERYGGRWCTVREEMDLQKLDEWIIFCDDYDMRFDEYLHPLLRNDIEDAIVLGRKVCSGEPSKQLFLASFRSGLLCHLGEGDYTCQLEKLVKGQYYDNVITEANLSIFFPQK